MREVTFPELTEIAQQALGELSGTSWRGGNGRIEFFSFWHSGHSTQIKIQNGSGQTFTEFYRHFVELNPDRRTAYFYKHGGHPEKRAVIERNLRAMDYSIEDKPSEWFNMTYAERELAA